MQLGNMSVAIEKITPATAAEWLEKHNTLNRERRSRVVNILQQQITAGHWLVTHQGIAFDTNGELIDGQHRLMAFVAAGVPLEVVVWRGVPVQTRMAVDRHSARNDADIATVLGTRASMKEMAVLRAAFPDKNAPRTVQDSIALYQKYQARIKSVTVLIGEAPKGIANAVSAAVLLRASYHPLGSEDEIRHIASVLVDGVMSGPRDRTLILARNRMLEATIRGSSRGSQAGYRVLGALLARAVVAYLKDESLHHLKQMGGSMRDYFSMPEDEVS